MESHGRLTANVLVPNSLLVDAKERSLEKMESASVNTHR